MKFRVLVLMMLSGLVLNAQDLRNFSFQGTVYDKADGKPLEGYLVDIYEGNSIIRSVSSEKKGRFSADLFGSGEFTIDIYQHGYYPKRVYVRTNVPEDIKKLPVFKFEVELIPLADYEDLEKVDPFATSIFDFPFVIFEFDTELNDLNYRKKYTDHIKKKYEEVADLR